MLGLIYLCAMLAIFKPWIHGRDGAAYYAWLRSAAVDRDLDTYNELQHYQNVQDVDLQSNAWRDDSGRTQTGLWINHWPVGSAVLWAPFFLLAHAATHILNLLGLGLPANGYSPPYVWLSMFGSTVWALLGLLLVYGIAKEIYDDRTATLATASIWLASPLVFYMFMYPTMSHANDAFANAVFVFVWYKTRRERGYMAWVALGLSAGLAGLVRTQNVLLAVFPGLELAADLVGRLRLRSWDEVRHSIIKAGLFAIALLIALAPQMLVWKAVFGSYIVLNPIQISMGLGFDLQSPHWLKVLFSSNRGLFVWHPILLPAAVGLWFLARRERRLALMLLIAFLLQLYLIGSYDAWHSSPAFGARYFVNMLPMFVLGLAALTDWMRPRMSFTPLVAAAAAFVLWNFSLIVQYSLQLVPRFGPVALSQMVQNQFLVVPRYLGRVVGLMLSRLSW